MPVSVASRLLVVRRRLVLRSAVAAVLCAAAVLSLTLIPRAARADAGSSLVGAANAARAAAGLPALSVSGDLASVASQQAARMAQSGVLAHTPNLSGVVCCWSSLGENVGEGPSASSVQAAFMASPMHRANILSSSYTQIGVGTAVDATGRLWVSEVFRRPSGAVAAPPAAPQPRRAPAPAAHVAPPAQVAPHTQVAAPQPAAAAAAPQAASRDLPGGRLPLEDARKLAGWLAANRVSGADPVSRLLDFAARTDAGH